MSSDPYNRGLASNLSAKKYPEKTKARRDVRTALRNGTLVRPDRCAHCNTPCKPEASHTDYARTLDVEWLCKKCHGKKDSLPYCAHGHLYTPENTYVFRSGRRECKTCNRARDAKRKALRRRHTHE